MYFAVPFLLIRYPRNGYGSILDFVFFFHGRTAFVLSDLLWWAMEGSIIVEPTPKAYEYNTYHASAVGPVTDPASITIASPPYMDRWLFHPLFSVRPYRLDYQADNPTVADQDIVANAS